MQGENELKKAFLKRYQECLKIEKSIEDEIRELRASVIMPAQVMDGMPHGTGKSDLSSYAVQVEKMFGRLGREMEHRFRVRREIAKTIEDLPTEAERMVMRFRYINGWGWEKVAVESNYDYRYTLKIHGKALNNLQLPEWFLIIQKRTLKDT